MTRTPALIALSLLLATIAFAAHAQSRSRVIGIWREPEGSVLEIFPCGNDVCARIQAVTKTSPTAFDIKNPDTAARTHRLCGLQIGYGFHLIDPAHADGGHLYDPKSGKTYRGSMTADGDTLHLRGYVGIKAFGRTEDWTRTTPAAITCPTS